MKPKLIPIVVLLLLNSCVASKEYKAVLAEKKQLERENAQLKRQVGGVQTIAKTTQEKQAVLSKEYDSLKLVFDSLSVVSDSTLKKQQVAIDFLQDSLSIQNQKLAKQDTSLNEKSEKVKKLRWLLNKRNKQLKQIKNSVSQALSAFKGKGLNLSTKEGKIWISLSNKLLFKSGSTELDQKAMPTIQKLANVLNQNPDFTIRIEGHTDNAGVLEGSPYQDNWELSVLRATAIVRVLEVDGVNPKRMIISGRGEHQPISSNKTTKGKAKNRRIEVILIPKLDALYDLLESK